VGEVRVKRIVRAASAVVPVLFLFFPLLTAAVPRNAAVPNEAWWNYYTLEPTVGTPTTVPSDAIGVGNLIGSSDKVAAIGLKLNAEPGSRLDALTLSLKESDAPLANVNAASAKVQACAITGPWAPAMNSDWNSVPSYDCDLGRVVGKRSDDGTWTFDLAPLGKQWIDSDFPLEQSGVIFFVPEASQPTQISFRSIRTGEFRLEFAVSAPAESEPGEPVVIGALPKPEVPAPAVAPQAPAAPADGAEPAILEAAPVQNRTEQVGKTDTLGNLPWATWLLVPLVVALAVIVSRALSPDAGSSKPRKRDGAVTRALARRARSDQG
jgi:hypothetical protein